MLLHILLFLLPWILFGLLVNKSELRRLFISGLFGAVIALTVDILQYSFHWWSFTHNVIHHIDVELSSDLGLYPVQSMLLIQYLPENKKIWSLWILAFSLFNTFGEYVLLTLGQLRYMNGWNIGWTFISYVIPFSLVALHSIYYANIVFTEK